MVLEIEARIEDHNFLNQEGVKDLTYQMPLFPSYRNQSIDLLCKSIDWSLYEDNTGILWINGGLHFYNTSATHRSSHQRCSTWSVKKKKKKNEFNFSQVKLLVGGKISHL